MVWDITDYRRLIHLDVLIRHSIARVEDGDDVDVEVVFEFKTD